MVPGSMTVSRTRRRSRCTVRALSNAYVVCLVAGTSALLCAFGRRYLAGGAPSGAGRAVVRARRGSGELRRARQRRGEGPVDRTVDRQADVTAAHLDARR